MTLKIYGASKEKTTHHEPTGKILVDSKVLKIAVEDGFIHLLEIQLPGKRKMRTQDLLNGFEIAKNALVT